MEQTKYNVMAWDGMPTWKIEIEAHPQQMQAGTRLFVRIESEEFLSLEI